MYEPTSPKLGSPPGTGIFTGSGSASWQRHSPHQLTYVRVWIDEAAALVAERNCLGATYLQKNSEPEYSGPVLVEELPVRK